MKTEDGTVCGKIGEELEVEKRDWEGGRQSLREQAWERTEIQSAKERELSKAAVAESVAEIVRVIERASHERNKSK